MDEDPVNRAQYLDMVERSIHKLDGVIRDVIDYSRNARTEIESARIEFEPLINGIFESLNYLSKNERIRKEIRIAGSGDFFTDVKRLQIVLFNLISNAIKYHNIERHDPHLIINIVHDDQNATIEVVDNGRGIEKDHLENIFKMFFRADESSTGSGLGLFIAREAIEKIQGKISVKSTIGKGSTFRIQ